MKNLIFILFLCLGALTVHAQKPNTFTGNIHFEIIAKDKINMKISTKKWQTVATVVMNKSDNVRMIFDLQNEDVTILTNSGPTGKMGIVSKLENLPEINEDVEGNTKVEKTNEKKDILGYECVKYVVTTDDGIAECWITDKVKFNPFESFGRLGNQSKKMANGEVFKEIEGLALETKYVDNNQVTTHIKVISIDNKEPEAGLFSTEGYNIIDMSSFPGMNNLGK